ncbi:MAG: hypothetical protein AB7U73_02570 [Pirellulales bacterium]
MSGNPFQPPEATDPAQAPRKSALQGPAAGCALGAGCAVFALLTLLFVVAAIRNLTTPELLPDDPNERYGYMVGTLCCPLIVAVPAIACLVLFVMRVLRK